MVSDRQTYRFQFRNRSRLNPCSNGIWSLTVKLQAEQNKQESVLILVLMEYGL